MTAVLDELNRLPSGRREAIRAELQRELARDLVEDVLRDPMSFTEETLASLYHAIAAGQTSGFGIERESTATERRDSVKPELVRRLELQHRLADDESAQSNVKREMKRSPTRFFDDWVWMTDPRRRGLKLIPFVLFEKQREIVDFIEANRQQPRSCMIEKTRDFGVSVIVIGLGVFYWLTVPQAIIGYGSRKTDLVHKIDDFDSLLEKAAIILRHLPSWLLPAGYDEKRHLNYMNIVNPETRAQIKGEGGDELGRGGRCMIFFADEFPKVKQQQKSHQSLSGTTDCTCYFGTSGGVNTFFYQMKVSGAYPLLTVPWYYDPRKLDSLADVGNPQADSSWKRAKMKELLDDEAAFNQEFGCDDSKSLSKLVIPPEWVRSSLKLREMHGVDELIASTTVAGVDLAEDGGDESVLALRRGAWVDPLQTWRNLELEDLAPKLVPHANAGGADFMYYDRSGLGSGFQKPLEDEDCRFQFLGVNGQSPADKFVRYDDNPTKPAVERFANKVTELWWSLRRRFHRTHRHVHGVQTYALDELIAIPHDETLILQLSARQFFENGRGKLQLEPKKKMTVSPDRADALAHAEETFLQRLQLTKHDDEEENAYETTSSAYEW